MSLLSLVRVSLGEVGILPGDVKMVSTDSLATITTAGYLNGVNNGNVVSGVLLAPSDIIECLYNFNVSTGAGTFTLLAVSISGGLITLSPTSGDDALTSAHIFVGNSSNVATDVAMTGDISITNAGVTAIVAGVIVNADINASAAIAFSKLAALTSGQILVGSVGNVPTAVAMSGDATIIASGALTIANSAITNAKVSASAAIDFSKLAVLASGNVLVGSAGGVATSVVMSGDATIIASGALTIASNAITTAKILDANVTSAKLALNVLHYTTVAITAAEFNGMYAAPKLLLAAGGANTLIVLDKVQLLMTYATAAYAAGGTAAVQYDSTVNGAGVIASTTLADTTFQATASTGWNFNAGVVAETFTTCVNKGLYLSNVTGAFTTGDSPMVAHIWYKIVPTV